MSAQPHRTISLVKDLLFQEKYLLSHTQMDLMAYLANVPYWARVVFGYYVLTTNKILSDLPNLGLKTFEASFKTIKYLGLVETKIVETIFGNNKVKVRGIRLTEKGKEYNKSLILPSQDNKIRRLEEEKQELLEKNRELEETIKNLTISKNSNPKKDEAKAVISEVKPQKDELDTFIVQHSKDFGANSKPICNFVPKYQRATIFYINSYNKLSIITPSNDFQQIKNPKEIRTFWEWLYQNPQRIGDEIDFSKAPTVNDLKSRFIGRQIKLGESKYPVTDITEVKEGVTITIKESNGLYRDVLNNDTKEAIVLSVQKCQEVLLRLLV